MIELRRLGWQGGRAKAWRSISALAWALAFVWAFVQTTAYAAEAAAVAEVTIGSGQGTLGETVAISVSLTTKGTAPSTINLGLLYDNGAFAYQGFTIGDAAQDAGKAIDDLDHHPARGEVRFVVYGNDTPMGDGDILTASFTVVAGEGEQVLELGVSEPSMASPVPESIDMILLGNCGAPPPPSGVTASQGDADGVLIRWEEAAGAAGYLVYRGPSDDPAAAASISGWLPSLFSYLDTDAAGPVAVGGGCAGAALSQVQRYYYWVRALRLQNDAFCASDLSTPAEGYRGAAKGLLLKGGAVPAVLPGEPINDSVFRAQVDSALCVRLKASEIIDPASVWGSVTSQGFETIAVCWVPLGGDDGWVVAEPETAWTPGELVTMTVGARTVNGAALESITYRFLVAPAAVPTAAVPQPAYGALDTHALDQTKQAAVSVADEEAGDSYDFEPVGPGYAISPPGVFGTPQRVWLPVPAGLDAAGLRVYYHQASGPDCGWHEAGQVNGWLVPETCLTFEWQGSTYLGLVVRHGGLVRLGMPAQGVSVGASFADVPVVSWVYGPGGDVLVLMLAATAFLVAAQRRCRAGAGANHRRVSGA